MQPTDAMRIWDKQDLNILDGLANAVCVNIYGLYENEHWYAVGLHPRFSTEHQWSAQHCVWVAALMECKRLVE